MRTHFFTQLFYITIECINQTLNFDQEGYLNFFWFLLSHITRAQHLPTLFRISNLIISISESEDEAMTYREHKKSCAINLLVSLK